MQFLELIKKNKLPVIIAIVAIIAGILGAIYYLDSSNKNIPPSNSTLGSNLKGYSDLKQKTNQLSEDSTIAQTPLYTRLIKTLSVLEDNKSTDENKYRALTDVDKFLQSLYADTNNHKLYILHYDLVSFAEANFPKLYKKIDFAMNCLDPICADSKQPEQISGIIEQLKQSDFPEDIKTSAIKDVINTGYYSDKDLLTKAGNYLVLANIIRSYSNFTKTGANTTISDNLYNFVKLYYPEQFKKLTKTPAATSGGLIKKGDY